MKVKDIMTRNPITIKEFTTIREAAIIMMNHNIQGLPVVDDKERLIGIFTSKELYMAVEINIDLQCDVQRVMNREVFFATENTDSEELFNMGIGRLPIVDEEKRVIGIITVADMLRAYYKRASYVTEELEAIFKSTHNGIVAVNNKGEIININKSALKIVASNEEMDVLGRRVDEIIPNSKLQRVLKTGQSELGDRYSINGFNVIVNRTPMIRNNEIVGAVATFQDITELMNTVRDLSDEKNLTRVLRTILDNAYDGIVVVDKEGKITMINNSYARFLNVEAKDVIGKHVTAIIENTRLHIVLKTGEAEIGEIQKIGENKIVVMRIPIKEDGRVVGAIGKIMFRDVQEVNSLAKKLNMIQNELEYYKGELKKVRQVKYSFNNIPDKSYKMKEVKRLATIASKSNSTILITGESGTGKELFAHSIHNESPRYLGPLIKMNCAAIPSELLESELFGYAEGAFTGAKKGGNIGKFELANGGTIFLDEIGDMPMEMQAKLLRVLQDKEIEPIGSNKPISVDVRIISATNKDLPTLIKEKKFREDLYYRLNVITINIPPLRERVEDLEELINILLKKHSEEMGKYIPGISSDVVNIFRAYGWPGNVRELENIIERAINIADSGELIKPMHLPIYLLKQKGTTMAGGFSLKQAVEDAEKERIIECLKFTKGNRVRAAELLKVSRSTLYEKLEKYEIKEV